ncbi:hypothetical protein [Naumannella halotolerans]|uniref:hypothetical protein n=1 Tax=Naumannella halotolerans TaxID=993414 RepID=UPI001061DAE4|nr:hypothetical protein [Naumannella halotolerans]
MNRTEGEQAARRAIKAWLAHHKKSQAWLRTAAKVDTGTLNEFLAGNRWPKLATQGKIEDALGWSAGTISAIAEGDPPPPLPGTDVSGDHHDDDLQFRKPDGISKDEWQRIRAESERFIQWQIDQAATER